MMESSRHSGNIVGFSRANIIENMDMNGVLKQKKNFMNV